MTDLARRERIAVAVLDLLTSSCAPTTVERNRRSDVDASEAPLLIVADLGHQASYENVGSVSYTMQIELHGIVAGPSAELGTGVNALYVTIIKTLSMDPSLGGLCTDLRETSLDTRVVPVAESAKSYAEFYVGLEARFETPDGDPTG